MTRSVRAGGFGAATIILADALAIGFSISRGPSSTNPTPSPKSDPTPSPALTPSGDAADCSVIAWQDQTMAFTVDNTTALSSEVAVIRFTGFGESLWNTVDGKRPEPMT